MLAAVAVIALAWSCTAVCTAIAVNVRRGESLGLEGGYLLLVSIPAWCAALAMAMGGAYRTGWRWPWLVCAALVVAAPVFVFAGGCVWFAQWWCG